MSPPVNQTRNMKAVIYYKGHHKVLSDQFLQFKSEIKPLPGISESRCFMCNTSFNSPEECKAHSESLEHKFRMQYRMGRRDILKNSNSSILVEFETEEIFLELNHPKKINFKLTNPTNKKVTLKDIVKLMSVNIEPGIEILGPLGIPIAPGQSVPYRLVAGFGQQVGIFVYPLIFQFVSDTGVTYVYKELKFFSLSNVDSDLFAALAPVSPYELKKKCFIHLVEIPTVSAPLLKNVMGDALPKIVNLPLKPVPSLLTKLVNHKLIFEFKDELDEKGIKEVEKYLEIIANGATNSTVLNKKNYRDRFSVLLFLEEMQVNKEMADYNMSGVTLFQAPTLKSSRYLALKIPGLVENRPCMVQNDFVYITLEKNRSVRYQGRVAHVNLDSIELLFDNDFNRMHNIGDKVSVEFEVNRYPYMSGQRAIEDMYNFDLVFPSKFKGVAPPDTPVEFFDEKIMSNPEQIQAVRNCLNGTSYPAPYIIFGPPGTGKTSTLIEIIKQLWLRANTNNHRIMVCAPSNAAADLITTLLLNSIPVNDIFRLYSQSRPFVTIPEKIKESRSSNFDADGNIWYPETEKLQAYKIIITTLVAASRLVTAGFGLKNHFSHIIIDESGQAHEPEAIIPLSGFAGSIGSIKGRCAQVILAGDPNQLGPIIISKLAAHMGLEISLLERLMSLDLYKKDKNFKYNPAVITKLVQNHRSHGAIIEASNKLFYDNELVVNGDKPVINMAIGWSELPNKNYPVLFHGVKGQEERESSSPSWFNRAEIITITHYLKKILKPKTFNGHVVKPEDIGIISPYHKQVMKLRKACQMAGWGGIKVGSVEEFQGSEKLITIVSTVRSNQEILCQDLRHSLGFLSNPKRLNVALTRARALMIVVGDPDVLICDHRWRTFIQQCRNNKAFKSDCYFNIKALDEMEGISNLTDDLRKIKFGK